MAISSIHMYNSMRRAASARTLRTRWAILRTAYATARSRELFQRDFVDLIERARMYFVVENGHFAAYCEGMRVEVDPIPSESLACIRVYPQVSIVPFLEIDMHALARFANTHIVETAEVLFDCDGHLCLQAYLVMPPCAEDHLDDMIAQLAQDGTDLRIAFQGLTEHLSLVRAANTLARLHAEHEREPWHPELAQIDQCCFDSRMSAPTP